MSPRLRQRAERVSRLFRLRRVADVEPQLPDTATAVAVIMDGNGRWARRRGLPTLAGHHAGTAALRRTVEAAPGLGVRSLAVYAFSTENWGRSEQEVTDLMALFADTIREQFPDLDRQGVQVRFVGRRDRCPADLLQLMTDMEERTAANGRLTLWVAFDYGGRDEIIEATRTMLRDGADPEAIDETAFRAHLYAPGMPDPDLVIRTSGELRISNFLLWQSAYAELHFTPTLWPDFGEDDLREALAAYGPQAAVRTQMSGLGSRVAVAVPLAVVALFAVYRGGWLLVGLALVGGLVATHEFCSMTRELRPLTIAGFAGVAAVIVAVHQGGLVWGIAALFGTLVVAFWLSAVADVHQTATVQLAVTLFGVCWIGYGLAFLVAVRDAPGPDDWGRQLLFAVVGAVWASDIFAYFAGRMFGRRKLAPVISPNKTIEGLLAGLLFGTAVGFFVLYDQPSSDPVTAGQALMLAAAISIASPVGDLFESYVKRDMQVKDTGSLLGGHGGVLDRIDALLFAGVAVYFVAFAIDRA